MNKLCKVILLPTDKAEGSILITKYNRAEYHGKDFFTQLYLKDNGIASHHLYILSDDEIKEGNHYIEELNNIGKAFKNNAGFYKDCKKIIATTDSSLIKNISRPLGVTQALPSIPKSFIDKYVSEYNKGNKIEEVMVEYTEVYRDPKVSFGGYDLYITLNPDNTINIMSIKDSWTREEVEYLLHGALWTNPPYNEVEANEWIKSHLIT